MLITPTALYPGDLVILKPGAMTLSGIMPGELVITYIDPHSRREFAQQGRMSGSWPAGSFERTGSPITPKLLTFEVIRGLLSSTTTSKAIRRLCSLALDDGATHLRTTVIHDARHRLCGALNARAGLPRP